MRETIISYDPSNGETVGEVEKNTLSDISQKVANAKMAQKKWATYTPEERV